MKPNTRVFSFKMPALVAGCGARAQLGALGSGFGKKAFVVTDPCMAAQPGFASCVEALEADGLAVATFTQVAPDPPIALVTQCAEQARQERPDVVIGIGGGSSLDVAKCAAVLLRCEAPLGDLFGIGRVPARGVPTILVPTTAGSGSEVTPIAILSDREQHMKKGIVSDHLIADVALVDPELAVTLPPGPTAYTGMDALTHAIEAYTNRFAVPMIDTLALEAIRLVGANLRRCLADGADIEARYGMSQASLFGGLCLKSVNTAAVHALAYPLGCEFDVPHGIANSLLLPHVMRFNAPVCAERFARIAEALGADDALAAVGILAHDVGTDRKMRDFKVRKEDLPRMAASAMEVQRLLSNNPREVTESDALAIYEAAW